VDAQLGLLYGNAAFLPFVRALGALVPARADLRGRALGECLPRELGDVHDYLRAVAEGRAASYTAERQCAGRWLQITANRLAGRPGGAVVTLVDVTAERRALERIRFQSELLAHVKDAVVATDADGKVVYWNDGAERIFGWTAEKMRGETLARLWPLERAADLSELYARVAAGEVETGERELRRADGNKVYAETRAAAIHRDDGGLGGYLCLLRDVTEARGMRLQAAQQEKLASVGMLAAGVAHEINNPLAFVLSNVEFLERRIPSLGIADGEVAQALREMRDGADRVRAIVANLSQFARVGSGQPARLDLVEVVKRALALTAPLLRHVAQVETELAPVPWVIASEGRLAQVVVNLVMNAAQAMPEGRVAENRVAVRTFARDGEAVLEVRDNGRGMTAEVRARAFEPFFTTKPSGLGTGLGLALSARIVQEAGGRIEAESGPGGGATFRITLPAAPAEP
jgi:PAS domain S-box-containing protein